ncbi:ornithine cyclodeaminase [Infirmifilum lucidum]|uniref:Ornithine cyclodeaminase n=1 Tax=Infirmifilum lucidum TaxID=2776706 RepID=A0A7L9FII1_9CREN|nr:ornithine cyclodeaminase [Infirmifilum lucidum]QOJ78833.1 ornithine cyclodeaminase [Infirmifilum lucidum]
MASGDRPRVETLLLDEVDVAGLVKRVGLEEFLRLMMHRLEEGFALFARGEIRVPARHEFYFEKGSVESMPAADSRFFAVKVVNTHPLNPREYGLSTIMALGVLVDGETGLPLMLAESTILTALRTAAATALATKYLARRDSEALGVIGTGAQSLPHLHALSLVVKPSAVYAYDVDSEALRDFASTASRISFDVSPAGPEVVASRADVLTTLTCKPAGTPPVVYNSWVRDGAHMNAVGSDSPGKVELEKALVERAKLVVDFPDQALREGEAQQVPREKVYAHLGEIVLGLKPGRTSQSEVTLFDSVGFAMEDLVAYKLVYELALREGVGRTVKIVATPARPKNIYASYFL